MLALLCLANASKADPCVGLVPPSPRAARDILFGAEADEVLGTDAGGEEAVGFVPLYDTEREVNNSAKEERRRWGPGEVGGEFSDIIADQNERITSCVFGILY